jgi:hypothetical protein
VTLPAFHGVAPVQGQYGRAWGKNGSTGAYNAMLMLLPDDGLKLGVVVLSNSDTAAEAVYHIARQSLLLAVQEKLGLAAPPAPKPLPDFSNAALTSPDEIAGLYETGGAAAYYRITAKDDGRLFWATHPYRDDTEGHTLTFKTDGSNAFAVEGDGFDIVFIDRDGHRLMVRSGGDDKRYGPNVVVTLGARIEGLSGLGPAWENRLDRLYLADQMRTLSEACLIFDYQDGLLLAQTPGTMNFITPENDRLAFVGGIMSRGDSAIRVVGQGVDERLHYLATGYFAVDQVEEWVENETLVWNKRSGLPLSVWRKVTVIESAAMGFAASPGDLHDIYCIHPEALGEGTCGRGSGGAVFTFEPGTYYLSLNPGIDSAPERTFTHWVVY